MAIAEETRFSRGRESIARVIAHIRFIDSKYVVDSAWMRRSLTAGVESGLRSNRRDSKASCHKIDSLLGFSLSVDVSNLAMLQSTHQSGCSPLFLSPCGFIACPSRKLRPVRDQAASDCPEFCRYSPTSSSVCIASRHGKDRKFERCRHAIDRWTALALAYLPDDHVI